MGNCLWRCLRNFLPWYIGASVISAIVAYFLGINIVIGTAVIISLSPGIIAALVALVGVFILLFIVGLITCLNRCRQR